MPVYTFECLDCHHSFDKRLSFSQSDVVPACESCQSEHVKRLLSPVAVFTTGADGAVRSTGGSTCSSCSSTSCSTCGSRR